MRHVTQRHFGTCGCPEIWHPSAIAPYLELQAPIEFALPQPRLPGLLFRPRWQALSLGIRLWLVYVLSLGLSLSLRTVPHAYHLVAGPLHQFVRVSRAPSLLLVDIPPNNRQCSPNTRSLEHYVNSTGPVHVGPMGASMTFAHPGASALTKLHAGFHEISDFLVDRQHLRGDWGVGRVDGVVGQRGVAINLQKVGLAPLIQHDIKAEKVKALLLPLPPGKVPKGGGAPLQLLRAAAPAGPQLGRIYGFGSIEERLSQGGSSVGNHRLHLP
mmetsp:Transcript_14355/g.22264  ORF Transcript_14355/g.22264 Transcript_14355/m.22264 type:complete len:270 (-) Transcript_14355:908-1717(-)